MNDIENLVAALAEEGAAVKAAPHPYRLSLKWLAAAAAYLAAALALSGVRPDIAHAAAQPWFVAELAALLLICVAASLSAALLAFPDLHQKRGLALTPLLAFLLFLGILSLAWIADAPPAPLPAHSFECTASIALVALVPVAWAFHAIRRLASTKAQWAGTTAVLGAFGVAALWLRLHEVNDSVAHVVAWHYLPMLAAAFLGYRAGRRFLSW